MAELIKAPKIGEHFYADDRRDIYDVMNSQIIESKRFPSCVFIGDSITELWDLENNFSDFKDIVNRGIGGDVIYGVKSRFDADVIQLKPKVCAMMIGINNVWFTERAFTEKEKTDINAIKAFYDKYIEKLVCDLEEMYKKAKDNGIVMLCCSVLPVRSLSDFEREYKNYYIENINKNIKQLAEKFGFEYVDYHSALKEEDGSINTKHTWDGVHPIGSGYMIMEQIIRPYLEKYLKANNRLKSTKN